MLLARGLRPGVRLHRLFYQQVTGFLSQASSQLGAPQDPEQPEGPLGNSAQVEIKTNFASNPTQTAEQITHLLTPGQRALLAAGAKSNSSSGRAVTDANRSHRRRWARVCWVSSQVQHTARTHVTALRAMSAALSRNTENPEKDERCASAVRSKDGQRTVAHRPALTH